MVFSVSKARTCAAYPMISPIVLGRVIDGKFIADDQKVFRAAFYCHENQAVEVSVKRLRKVRSMNQNKYYWSVVIAAIGKAMGESDPEAVHAALKYELNYYIMTVGKKEIRVPLSTAELNTAEFEEYLEKCRRWASEFLCLYIQLPNEVTL